MANKKIKNPIIREQLARSGKNFKETKSKPVKKIDTRTERQKNSKKTRSQPVRGRKIIDPRTREELEKRRTFKKIPIGKKPVFGDVTQGFKDTIQSVINEGGSPKLTTTEAIVDRSVDKLSKPKLALKGGGRAYGKNS